jgi:hypothetical protein
MHLPIEINNGVISEGLVDTSVSMSIMAAGIIRELGIMHLVSGHETYKTTFGTITTALGRLDDKMFQVGYLTRCSKWRTYLKKVFSWKGGCSSGPNYHNDEGSSHDNMTEFVSETDEEDARVSLIMQENDAALEDDLKDQGLNHLFQ